MVEGRGASPTLTDLLTMFSYNYKWLNIVKKPVSAEDAPLRSAPRGGGN